MLWADWVSPYCWDNSLLRGMNGNAFTASDHKSMFLTFVGRDIDLHFVARIALHLQFCHVDGFPAIMGKSPHESINPSH